MANELDFYFAAGCQKEGGDIDPARERITKVRIIAPFGGIPRCLDGTWKGEAR